jgi:WD domain, G-beta repeat
LFLLFIEETSLGQILSKEALHPKGSGGPNQGAEMGQIRVPKSLRYLLVGLAILLVASAILSFIAYTRQQHAVAESKKNQELLYVADMKAAFQAAERGDAGEVRRLLEAHLPSAGTDLRRFEWFWLWRVYHNEKAELKGHDARVFSVAFSPDSKTLASGSNDNTVKGHADRVNSVAFSPDGKTLASGSEDKTVKLWDAQTGRELAMLKGHDNRVNTPFRGLPSLQFFTVITAHFDMRFSETDLGF